MTMPSDGRGVQARRVGAGRRGAAGLLAPPERRISGVRPKKKPSNRPRRPPRLFVSDSALDMKPS